MNTRLLIGLFNPSDGPFIHFCPQLCDLGNTIFPFPEHLSRLCLGLRVLLRPGVEFYIVVTDEMIALYPLRFRSGVVPVPPVGKHGLADMYAPVVDQIDLLHLRPVRVEDPGHAFTNGIVTQMTEVQGLVRIGA